MKVGFQHVYIVPWPWMGYVVNCWTASRISPLKAYDVFKLTELKWTESTEMNDQ